MQTANATTINNPIQWDDMVNLHARWLLSIDFGELFSIYPARSGALNCRPVHLLGEGKFRPVLRIGFVPSAPPSISVRTVIAEVFRSAFSVFSKSAWLAAMADGQRFLVELGTGLNQSTGGAFLGSERLRTTFHNGDIIPRVGDVKPRELLGTPVRAISSQAPQECGEGSETRPWSPERTVKAHERAAPQGDEIVRPVQSNVQKREIKSLRDNTTTTIQNRSGELADNVT